MKAKKMPSRQMFMQPIRRYEIDELLLGLTTVLESGVKLDDAFNFYSGQKRTRAEIVYVSVCKAGKEAPQAEIDHIEVWKSPSEVGEAGVIEIHLRGHGKRFLDIEFNRIEEREPEPKKVEMPKAEPKKRFTCEKPQGSDCDQKGYAFLIETKAGVAKVCVSCHSTLSEKKEIVESCPI